MSNKKNVTALKLLRWNMEAQSWKQNESLLDEFFAGKLNAFLRENEARITSLMNQRERIEKEFFEFDEAGKVKMQKGLAVVGKDGKEQPGQPKPVMKEGKTMEDYRKALDEFHNQVIPYSIV